MLLLDRESRLNTGLYRRTCKDKINYSTNNYDFWGYIGFARDTFRKINETPVLWEGTNGDYRFVTNDRILNVNFDVGVQFDDNYFKMRVYTPEENKSLFNDFVFPYINASIFEFHRIKGLIGHAPPAPLNKKLLERVIEENEL